MLRCRRLRPRHVTNTPARLSHELPVAAQVNASGALRVAAIERSSCRQERVAAAGFAGGPSTLGSLYTASARMKVGGRDARPTAQVRRGFASYAAGALRANVSLRPPPVEEAYSF